MSRKFLLTVLVVAAIIVLGWAIGATMPDSLTQDAVYVCAGLFSLAIIRSTLLRPLLVLRRWARYADEHGYEVLSGEHGEPRMVGGADGVKFLLAQSTELLGGGGGYYARTMATATVERGVPDGLRVYRKDALEWNHHLSGLRSVSTGDEHLDSNLVIEGSDAAQTRAWVVRNRALFDELSASYPRFIVYGSEIDGLPVALGTASGAVTVLVVGRKSRPTELERLITDVTRFAQRAASG